MTALRNTFTLVLVVPPAVVGASAFLAVQIDQSCTWDMTYAKAV